MSDIPQFFKKLQERMGMSEIITTIQTILQNNQIWYVSLEENQMCFWDKSYTDMIPDGTDIVYHEDGNLNCISLPRETLIPFNEGGIHAFVTIKE